jgi:hypothetical protein
LSSPLRGPGGNLLNVILYIDGMETITQSWALGEWREYGCGL